MIFRCVFAMKKGILNEKDKVQDFEMKFVGCVEEYE